VTNTEYRKQHMDLQNWESWDEVDLYVAVLLPTHVAVAAMEPEIKTGIYQYRLKVPDLSPFPMKNRLNVFPVRKKNP
jgi:hypothetical protein